MRNKVIALLVGMSLLVVGVVYAAKQINLVATERMVVTFAVVRSGTDWTCDIAVSGAVLDNTGDTVKSESFTMKLDDLGPTMKAQVIDILKAANKKLNLQAIDENVNTLPELQ